MSRLWLLIQTLIFIALGSAPVFAQYTSPNYKTNEVFFGSGGEVESTSPNFKAQSSVGGLAVGKTSSSNYQAFSGFLTPGDPFLEMNINTTLVDLGNLDTASTKTGTATFQVRAYTNSGYTVLTMSQPPRANTGAGTHTLTAKTTLAAPSLGTEEFGMNLVDNATPNIGANPSLQPDSSFANGQAASGYSTVDQFKYNQGDIIAQTNTSGWGLTIFTISYIADISVLTPAGNYSMVHDLVVVPVY